MRQRELSGRRMKSDSLPRLIQPKLHVGTVSMELRGITQPKWRYRIDLERRYSTYGKDHGLSASVKTILVSIYTLKQLPPIAKYCMGSFQ